MDLDKSYATDDARFTKVSDRRESYSLWKKEGYAGKVVVGMDTVTAAVAGEIKARNTEKNEITLGLRSALAQLGLDTVVRDVKVNGRVLELDMLFLSMDGDRSDIVLDALISNVQQRLRPIVGRGLVFPEESRLSKNEAEVACAEGECAWDPRSIVRDDGLIAIPPLDMEYEFAKEAYHPATLRKVLGGASGRAMLKAHRTTSSLRPMLERGGFFVGGFKLNLPGMIHAMLRRGTVDGKNTALLPIHSAAGFLEAGRTDEIFGDRQIEVTNVNGEDCTTSSVHVLAALHRAAKAATGDV